MFHHRLIKISFFSAADLPRQHWQQYTQKELVWATFLSPIRALPALGVARPHHFKDGASGLWCLEIMKRIMAWFTKLILYYCLHKYYESLGVNGSAKNIEYILLTGLFCWFRIIKSCNSYLYLLVTCLA